MPAATPRGIPYPLTADPFLPASVDFPALAAAIESKTARDVAAVLSASPVLDVGVLGQVRAGRDLVAADFTSLLGITAPVGLWDLGSLTNLGSGGNLTNKGSVPLTAKGVAGTANHAALFAGSTGQALYLADTGSGDPFRIATGSWGCWVRTAKKATNQNVITRGDGGTSSASFEVYVNTSGVFAAYVSVDGSTGVTATGTVDVTDNRWHHVVCTFDGSVIWLWVDGVLDASGSLSGPMYAGAGTLNIGALFADASTIAASPHFGRIAAPFVTADVLSQAQIRLLMAAKVAHGYPVTPTRAHVAIRRKRRGGPFVVGDFTVTPKVLYNFAAGALTDAGSLGATLTNNGPAVSVAGPDGRAGGAFHFNGSSQYLSGPSTGLPAALTSRSGGAWFKLVSTGATARGVLTMGGGTGTDFRFVNIDSAGTVSTYDGTTGYASVETFADGRWHFAVSVFENSAADGLKVKLYVDGRLVASGVSLASTSLGTGTLQIGRIAGLATNYFPGSIKGAFVTDYAIAADEVASLYAKGSATLPAQPTDESITLDIYEAQTIESPVQALDATNVYVLVDRLTGGQNALDLRVAA